MSPPVLVGVDGGGTRTSIGFSTDGENIRLSRHERPGRVAAGSEGDAAERLVLSLAEAHQAARIDSPYGTIVLGLAGAGTPTVAEHLVGELARRLDARGVHVVTDAEIAFADAFPDGRGILLSAGTGSIAVASKGVGQPCHRTGGHGWRFGDEGSGYAIGRDAIKAVLEAQDDRGAPTALADHITASDFFDSTEPRAVAALTEVVCACFAAGDEIAGQIVTRAVTHLAGLVQSLDQRLQGELPIAFSGGLLDERLPFRPLLAKDIEDRRVPGLVLSKRIDPIRGAIRLAARLHC